MRNNDAWETPPAREAGAVLVRRASWGGAMTTCRLDEVGQALAAALERGQAQINRNQLRRLNATITVDRQGRPEFLAWECRVPTGDGGERPFALLRLPWASLCHTETLQLSELSIELDCAVSAAPGEAGQQAVLQAVPVMKRPAAPGKTHRVKLSARPLASHAVVSIDDLPVENFLRAQDLAGQTSKEEAGLRRFLLGALLVAGALCATAAVACLVFYLL